MAADASNHVVARMVLTYLYDNNMQDLAEQFWNRSVYLSKAVPSAVLARMVSIGRLTNVLKEHTELVSILNDFWTSYMVAGSEKVFMTPSGKATILVDMCKSLLSFIPTEAPIQFLSEPIYGESTQSPTRIVLMEEGNVNLNEFPIEFDPNTLQIITDEPETQNRVDQSEQKENIQPIVIEIPSQPEPECNSEMPVTAALAPASVNIAGPSADVSPDPPAKKRCSERSAIKLKRLHNTKHPAPVTRARLVPPRSASKYAVMQRNVKCDLPKRSAGRITTTIKSASQNRLNSITPKGSKKDALQAQLHNESSSSSTATMSPESDEGIRQMTYSLQKHRRTNRYAQKQSAEQHLSNVVQTQFSYPATGSIPSKAAETSPLNSACTAAVSTLLQTTNVGEDTISAVLAHIHGQEIETAAVNHPQC
ncbi:uncharacterized protein LOC126573100 [Anopheles aquasalis]|uniref:uncharacterized protein LOC126573100 n=1 Tax=Anopheles aquasalis TaxID=42839 RepID=UPI00215B36E7|nr:uncharacterized protein LOC126573100 [Anopheles aquasalis]XP_050088924.1 uncharacterized protein LOC126573100 [Anopheles aquasalis]XP_050088925.1 uncharacterized protein LOC126573100 [Anopheles aquasalis]